MIISFFLYLNFYKMKNQIIILLSLFFINSYYLIAQNETQLLASKKEGNNNTFVQPRLLVNESTTDFIDIEYQFENVKIFSKIVDGNKYNFVHTKDFNHMSKVGFPAVPSHIEVVAMPNGAQSRVTVLSSEYIDYVGYNVHPALQPASDSIGAPEPPFEINRAQYENNEFFPSRLVDIVEHQEMREAQLALVEIHPVQFNPVTKTLRVYSKIRYRVDYIGASSSFDDLAKSNSINYLNILNNLVLNNNVVPDQPDNSGTGNVSNADYIIITHNDYLSAANELGKWKEQLGYTVEIISKSYWTSNAIEDTVSTKYYNYLPRPDYVLFMGDVNKVPGTIITDDGDTYASDLYYVCMGSSSDYTADMARGRISVSNLAEANLIVQKIINYEKSPPTDPNFYSSGLNCAEFQDYNNDNYADRRFSRTSEDVRNYMLYNQSFNVDRVYYTSPSDNPTHYNNGSYGSGEPLPFYLRKPFFQWNGSANDVINGINSGKLYVLHRDHGSTSGWGKPSFKTNNISSLTNGNKLPVMFSINCSSGNFLANCFAENIIRHPHGGVVGIFAASEVSYSGYNDALAIGLIDAIWSNPGLIPNFTGSGGTGYTPPAHSPVTRMGDVLNQGLARVSQTWGGSSGTRRRTNELFHYHGDPAMKIWTDVPTPITASHNAQILCTSTALSISNSSYPFAYATIYANGEIIGSTQLFNGSGVVYFSALNSVVQDFTLTISGTNCIPYIANITVNCPFPPQANFVASTNEELICNGHSDAITFEDVSTFSPNQWQWSFNPNTVTFVNGTNLNSQNPEVLFNSPGFYNVQLIATNPNGQNTKLVSNYIEISNGANLPLIEGFETGIFPPQAWEIVNPDVNRTWETDFTSSGTGGLASAYINYFSYASSGQTDDIISPNIDLTNSLDAHLSFYVAYQQFFTYSDSLKVFVSADCGLSYDPVPLYSKGGQSLETVAGSSNFYPSGSSDWRQEIVDLSSYVGNEIKIKFEGYCDFGNNLFIDDINIYQNISTGLQRQDKNNIVLNAYPNPSSGKVFLEINNLPEENFNINIYNALGQEMINRKINAKGDVKIELNVDEFASGMYIINVNLEDKFRIVKLIVN